MINRREAVSDISPQSDAINEAEGRVQEDSGLATTGLIHDGEEGRELRFTPASEWPQIIQKAFPWAYKNLEEARINSEFPKPLKDIIAINRNPRTNSLIAFDALDNAQVLLRNYSANFGVWARLFEKMGIHQQDTEGTFSGMMDYVKDQQITPQIFETPVYLEEVGTRTLTAAIRIDFIRVDQFNSRVFSQLYHHGFELVNKDLIPSGNPMNKTPFVNAVFARRLQAA